MEDPYEKGVAIHSAPNFARCVARHAVKRKTGEEAGWVLSSEKHQSGRRRCQTVRKATRTGAVARVPERSCVVEDPRHVSILSAREPGDLPGVPDDRDRWAKAEAARPACTPGRSRTAA